MYQRLAVVALTGVVVAACSDSTTPSDPARLAPLAEVGGNIKSQLVADEYIVALRSPVGTLGAQAQSIAAAAGAEVIAVFGAALNGFAVRADAPAIATIRSNPVVEYVEPVQVFRKIATQSPTPSWGLDRIDQRNLPLNNSYTYPTGGSAVNVYIIDTGLLTTHNEFTGRVGLSSNHITPTGGSPAWTDCDGHGTHVAGTAAGTTYGVMKTATVHAVRVLDCFGSGTTTSVVAGINWVIANAVSPAVSNMSLGGGASTALDNATNNMHNAGIVSAVAAGNGNAAGVGIDACTVSPARAANAVTTGATTISDARATFSNFGTCVDIFAPGVNIFSSYIGSNNATATLSGTSMASPHVAGVAALYRSHNPTHTAAQTVAALTSNATTGVVGNPGTGSPNRLLYMGFIGGAPPNQNPIADFTSNCVARVPGPGFDCSFNGTSSSDPDGTVVGWSWSPPGKPVKTGSVVSYVYPAAGTFNMTLTVTDNLGATGSKTASFVVGGGPPVNQPPIADFTYNCVARVPGPGFDCFFNGTASSDPDGTVVGWSWSPPGKPVKTGANVSYVYPTTGTFNMTLTVTDNNGATNTKATPFTVP